MLTAALAALALAVLAAAVAGCRAAGRHCYRINRDAYKRAQAEWAAAHRNAHPWTKGAREL